MKLLLDVCAGGRLRLWLERRGHDVAEVRRRSPSLGDSDVIAWAWEEERRSIIPAARRTPKPALLLPAAALPG